MARVLIRVAMNELTCVVCGEVTGEGFCARCNHHDEDGLLFNRKRQGDPSLMANLVPTISYLREDEYVVVK